MEIEKALKIAKDLLFAATSKTTSSPWMITQGGIAMYSDEVMSGDEAAEFMKLLLNTFIDVHNSLSKSLEENEDLRYAYIKYGEPFVHALQKSAKEHTHNFVQQWLDQHRDDENNHLINFGPTNDEPKECPDEIDPVSENPIDNDPKESEKDIPQIVINIGELNINFPAEEEESEQSTKTYNVILEDAGAAKLQVAKAIKMACSYTIPEAKALVDLTPSIIAVNIPLDKAEKLKKIVETQGAVASIKEFSK